MLEHSELAPPGRERSRKSCSAYSGDHCRRQAMYKALRTMPHEIGCAECRTWCRHRGKWRSMGDGGRQPLEAKRKADASPLSGSRCRGAALPMLPTCLDEPRHDATKNG